MKALAFFIAYPLAALGPALTFGALHLLVRRRVTLAAAAMWLAYTLWELGMKLRVLCSGECNIRVDLLLIYPALLLVSGAAGLAGAQLLMARRRRGSPVR